MFASTWGGHAARVNDPQIQLTEDFLILKPQGVETERMVLAPLGIVAMAWPAERLSFVKHSPHHPLTQYPPGCNLAVYVGPDNYRVEMETFGPEQTVLPGDTIENAETWKLLDTALDWQDPTILRDLFRGV